MRDASGELTSKKPRRVPYLKTNKNFLKNEKKRKIFEDSVGVKGLNPDRDNLILPFEKQNFYIIDKFF